MYSYMSLQLVAQLALAFTLQSDAASVLSAFSRPARDNCVTFCKAGMPCTPPCKSKCPCASCGLPLCSRRRRLQPTPAGCPPPTSRHAHPSPACLSCRPTPPLPTGWGCSNCGAGSSATTKAKPRTCSSHGCTTCVGSCRCGNACSSQACKTCLGQGSSGATPPPPSPPPSSTPQPVFTPGYGGDDDFGSIGGGGGYGGGGGGYGGYGAPISSNMCVSPRLAFCTFLRLPVPWHVVPNVAPCHASLRPHGSAAWARRRSYGIPRVGQH